MNNHLYSSDFDKRLLHKLVRDENLEKYPVIRVTKITLVVLKSTPCIASEESKFELQNLERLF